MEFPHLASADGCLGKVPLQIIKNPESLEVTCIMIIDWGAGYWAHGGAHEALLEATLCLKRDYFKFHSTVLAKTKRGVAFSCTLDQNAQKDH